MSRLSSDSYADLEIFERDDWACYLCGGRVDRELPRLHPDGATIDHIVPISAGGKDEPSNVATAHWKCNRSKGAKTASTKTWGRTQEPAPHLFLGEK